MRLVFQRAVIGVLILLLAVHLWAELAVELDSDSVASGGVLSGKITGLAPREDVVLEWRSAYSTVLLSQTLIPEAEEIRFSFPVTSPTSISNLVVARTTREEASSRFRTILPMGPWRDYLAVVSFGKGPPVAADEVIERAREAGFHVALAGTSEEANRLTWKDFHIVSSELIKEKQLFPNPEEWEKAIRAYEASKVRTVFARFPFFGSRESFAAWEEAIHEGFSSVEGFSPEGYILFDRFGVTPNGDCYDLPQSPEALERFREYLKGTYRTLDALSDEWQRDYVEWSEIVPLSLDETLRLLASGGTDSSLSPWIDYRKFVTQEFTSTVLRLAARAREITGGPVGLSGSVYPNPFNGVDLSSLIEGLDFLSAEDILENKDRIRSRSGEARNSILTEVSEAGRMGAHTLWRNLFRGDRGSILSWKALSPPEGRLAKTEVQLAASEINAGLGTLFVRLVPRGDPVAIYDSPTSDWAYFVYDALKQELPPLRRDAWYRTISTGVANRLAWLRLLEDGGVHADFLRAEDLRRSDLLLRYRLLILPKCLALSDNEIEFFKKYVESGGVLVIDSWAGLVDEHGKWRRGQPLEEYVGFKRKEGPILSEYSATYHGPSDSSEEFRFPVKAGAYGALSRYARPTGWQILESGLSSLGAKTLLDAGGTRAVFLREREAGVVLYLNLSLLDYPSYRGNPQVRENLKVLRDFIFEIAGVQPQVRLSRNGGETEGWEAFVWNDVALPEASYVAILANRKSSPPGQPSSLPEEVSMNDVRLELPNGGFVYDLRRGRLIAKGQEVHFESLDLAEPLIVSVLPYEVSGIAIALEQGADRLEYQVEVLTQSPERNFATHIAKIDVSDQEGKSWPELSRKVVLSRGLAKGSIPLPIGLPRGVWDVKVRDVNTGLEGVSNFTVP